MRSVVARSLSWLYHTLHTLTVATLVSPFQFSDTGVSVIVGNACSIGFRLSRRGQFSSKCTDTQLSRSYLCPFKHIAHAPETSGLTHTTSYVDATPLSQTVCRTSLWKNSFHLQQVFYKTPLAQLKEGQMPELPYQVLTFTLFPPGNTFPLHFYTHLWREEDTPLQGGGALFLG